jgi:AcrR family transcriptional regulator
VRANPPQRVVERRRAVLLTQHYRHEEGLTVPQIAARMGLSEGSIRAYLHDPDGSKAQAIKESYRGVCEVCGAATSGEGPGRARPVCTRCANQDHSTWSPRRIHAALRAWRQRYGQPATSTDLSAAHAYSDGGARLRRLSEGWEEGPWPAASVVQYHCGSVQKANSEALTGA